MTADALSQDYDFIVVGAGPAGCALAARLSERADSKVLLIEAGKDYAPGHEPPEILDTFAATAYADPRFIWPRITARFGPRPGNAPDRRPRRLYNQGRVIGGTSSINGMAANRGLPSDYDEWAARGATGWNWDGVLPFFKKLESDSNFDGPLHGQDGPIHIQRYPESIWPGFTRGVMTAIANAGYPDIQDQNGVFTDGHFAAPYSHTDTQRMGPAWRYLTAEVRRRPNLTVVGETHAHRIIFEGTRAIGVEVRQGGERTTVRGREIVVSCGALQSPALLMRSGVGPARALGALGIPIVADRAGVGQHLMEHPGVNFGFYMKPGARLPSSIRRQMFAGLRWSSGHDDCPAGDMFLIPNNKAQWHAIGVRLGLMMLWVNRSYSTGEVTLTSSDPNTPPEIDFNMASDPRDLDRLVTGVRLMCRLQADPAVQEHVEQVFPISFSDYARRLALYSPLNAAQTWIGATLMDASPSLRHWLIARLIADAPSLDDLANDDEACREWIRGAVLGHWHASCTCRMGRADDPGAVTGPDARVHGVQNLRVADASIMPLVPCANTNIPTIMIGEKVSAMILADT